MDKTNIIVSATLTLLISGCSNMNYRQQAALKGAAAGTLLGGGIGAGIAAATSDNENRFMTTYIPNMPFCACKLTYFGRSNVSIARE